MKKYSFFFFNAAFFCLSLSGCSSDNDIGNAEAEVTDAKEVTLYGQYEMTNEMEISRTVVDALGKQFWGDADVINVNGNKSTRITLEEGNASAALTVTAASPYYAFYPGDASGLAYDAGTKRFTFNFPATQAYNENSGYLLSDGVNPMVATSVGAYLSFYNVCGILRAEILANAKNVSKIRFLSADKDVAGSTSVVDVVWKTLTVAGTTGKSMDVTFSSPRTLSVSTPLTVCWVLPVNTYGTGWKIELLNETGSVVCQQVFTSVIKINRAKIINVSAWMY